LPIKSIWTSQCTNFLGPNFPPGSKSRPTSFANTAKRRVGNKARQLKKLEKDPFPCIDFVKYVHQNADREIEGCKGNYEALLILARAAIAAIKLPGDFDSITAHSGS
jgi:hypothetical protein